MTTKEILKRRLEELEEKDPKALDRVVVVLELPFVVDEDEVKSFFKPCGSIKHVEIKRSGALVFSSAIVEFSKKNSVKSAVSKAESFSGEFDVVIIPGRAFLDGNYTATTTPTPNENAPSKKDCIIQ
eukprot:gb/GECH01014874.1/.p1 GENE.gb/GECH01014874.1/~~gb/GECH01014874.1/.p1  ORF type:complete len:127 (+),score=18.38 gb/GECH01014874.1/:1-381(+)